MDAISHAVGSDRYLSFWNPDFLDEELGENGTIARLYPLQRLAIDVGNPDSKINRKKAALLSKRGFQYLCLPENSTIADFSRFQPHNAGN